MVNQPKDDDPGQFTAKPVEICPFLGVSSDPQTRVAFADARNYCHSVKPPQSVALSYQEAYCLSHNYQTCEVYGKAGAGGLTSKAKGERTEKAELSPGSSGTTVPQSGIDTKPGSESSDTTVPPDTTEEHETGEGEEQLRSRLREEALKRYQDVAPSRKGLWVILLFIALVVLAVSVYGFVSRFRQLSLQSQKVAVDNSNLATTIADMALAADAVATARDELDVRAKEKATEDAVNATSAMLAMELIAAMTPTVADIYPTSTITSTAPIICQDVSTTSFEIISGPEISPPSGYQLVIGEAVPPLEASWVIKNAGDCIWQKVSLWSQDDNVIVVPSVSQNEQVIDQSAGAGLTLPPGQVMKISLRFKFTGAWQVTGEWVLVVNNQLSLYSKPHLTLDVQNWIITLTPTPDPYAIIKATKQTPSGGEGTPPPNSRPAATSPGGRP